MFNKIQNNHKLRFGTNAQLATEESKEPQTYDNPKNSESVNLPQEIIVTTEDLEETKDELSTRVNDID
jgi:hypothetical protein